MTGPLIRVAIACNSPMNGAFLGRAEEIDIHGGLMQFESCNAPRAPRLVQIPMGFRLAGKTWPFELMKEWHGSWCWNAYWMRPDDAIEFLLWLRRRDLFVCAGGMDALYDEWHRPGRLYPNRVKQLLLSAIGIEEHAA